MKVSKNQYGLKVKGPGYICLESALLACNMNFSCICKGANTLYNECKWPINKISLCGFKCHSSYFFMEGIRMCDNICLKYVDDKKNFCVSGMPLEPKGKGPNN